MAKGSETGESRLPDMQETTLESEQIGCVERQLEASRAGVGK